MSDPCPKCVICGSQLNCEGDCMGLPSGHREANQLARARLASAPRETGTTSALLPPQRGLTADEGAALREVHGRLFEPRASPGPGDFAAHTCSGVATCLACGAFVRLMRDREVAALRRAEELQALFDRIGYEVKAHPALVAERDDARAALRDLVARLDAVHADSAYLSVWTIAQIHVGPYRGPTYVEALDAARRVLAASPGADDGHTKGTP